MNKRNIQWLVSGLVAALLCAVGLNAIRTYIIAPYTLPTAAMEPSVKRGAYFFLLKVAYPKPESVKRGDIVAHRFEYMGRKNIYLKRVIGIPGDRVRASGANLEVNGVQLTRRAIGESGSMRIFEEQLGGALYQIQIGPVLYALKDADVIVPKDGFL
jgi:signal peptidase I